MPDISYKISDFDCGSNVELTKETVVAYVQGKIEDALQASGDVESVTGQVVLKTEGVNGRTVQKVNVVVYVGGKILKQSAHSRTMKRAIDKAAKDLERQARDVKEKKVARRRHKVPLKHCKVEPGAVEE